ncbi:MAG: AAA family ATPase [Streptosporangiales bacterium]|nr:AAA family ATPase [Streptosporangiales bacterium]
MTPLQDTGSLVQDSDAGWHRHLTVLEGWRAFLGHDPEPPQPMTAKARAMLAEDERLDYDEQRIDYHVRLGVIQTPMLAEVLRTGRLLAVLNREAVSARRGLILSGQAGTGKTTALAQLGKRHEILDRRRNPNALPGTRIPVAYVTVPPAATPKMLAAEFARFLGLPVGPRANITDIIEAACGVLTDCRTSLVLVDEIHNLQLETRAGAEVSDTLKYFSERIPATFVYAGIDVERKGLFNGTRGQQIAGRFTMLGTRPFPYAEQWRAIVATFDTALLLGRHSEGTLAGLDEYLHDRTGGMIGSLSHLIRAAAVQAIITGTEKITRAALEAITLDHAAEQQRRNPKKPR